MVTLFQSLRDDVKSVFDRDPAAQSVLEVVLCYSGLHGVWAYRLNHWLWNHHFRLFARWLSQVARLLTGIEIHPAAQIGRRLFIDHGMGVVIGETCIVGDDVTLYQGVTLGGTGKEKGKRHPTIGSGVVIGAGAKVLGNIHIGDNCRVGAGSVILRDVAHDSTVVGVPGHVILQHGKRVVITDPKQITDPLSDALQALASQVDQLKTRVQDLEGKEQADPNESDNFRQIIASDHQI
jgi:serine O-acetyltransferase